MRRAGLSVERLESREVPAVTYDATAHLPVSNSLLLNEQTFFNSPNYNAKNGALQVQLISVPTQGTVSLNGYDFVYTPYPGTVGTDEFFYDVLQNGVSLAGQQEVDFNLGPAPPPSPGTTQAQLTFQTFTLNANNSDKALFTEETTGTPMLYPAIDLSVSVQGVGMPTGTASRAATSEANSGVSVQGVGMPTGTVTFTYGLSGGPQTSLGVAPVGPDGRATVTVDSGLLSQPGVVVQASYSGDALFAASVKSDNGKTSGDLTADPAVTDNPVINPNAQNLTVVIVGGKNAAEKEAWIKSARDHYGTDA